MKWKLNRIGRKVTKFRRSQGWTQGDLVIRLRIMGCGMTLQTLQDIESHRRAVTDAEVVCLSEAFGIPLKHHIPMILQEGQEAGKIVPGDPHLLALTIGAVVQGLVAISVDGKIKGDSLNVIVPEVIGHVLNGLSASKTKTESSFNLHQLGNAHYLKGDATNPIPLEFDRISVSSTWNVPLSLRR